MWRTDRADSRAAPKAELEEPWWTTTVQIEESAAAAPVVFDWVGLYRSWATAGRNETIYLRPPRSGAAWFDLSIGDWRVERTDSGWLHSMQIAWPESAEAGMQFRSRAGRSCGTASRVACTLAGCRIAGAASPPNQRPAAVGTIPDQSLEQAGSATTLDVAHYFRDPDGDTLTYGASSSHASVRVTRSGSELTLTPMSEGEAVITVTATDPDGLSATQRFRVTVAAASCSVEHLGTLRNGVPLTRNGSLGSDCVSPNREGALARFYSFTLPDSAYVQIDMASATLDAFLILRAGHDVSGRSLREDDDGGGRLDARITTGLPAGRYTIEATSFARNHPVTGAFTLTVRQTTGRCGSVEHLGTLRNRVPVTRSGSLGPDCVSPNREGALARYYSFTLPDTTEVQIDMASAAFDAFLVLREGQNVSGRSLREDDDRGGGTDARITSVLAAGSYTVEATSFLGHIPVSGAFTLTVRRTSTRTGRPFEVRDTQCVTRDLDNGRIAVTAIGVLQARLDYSSVRVRGIATERGGAGRTHHLSWRDLGSMSFGESKTYFSSGTFTPSTGTTGIQCGVAYQYTIRGPTANQRVTESGTLETSVVRCGASDSPLRSRLRVIGTRTHGGRGFLLGAGTGIGRCWWAAFAPDGDAHGPCRSVRLPGAPGSPIAGAFPGGRRHRSRTRPAAHTVRCRKTAGTPLRPTRNGFRPRAGS